MTLGTKSTLIVLAVYLVLLGGLVWSLDRWLASFNAWMTGETVSVIARERAAHLMERSLAALQTPDAKSRSLLRERIDDVVLLSEGFSSVTVVDRDGEVVSSDRPGSWRPRPAEVFGQQPEVKVQASAVQWFHGGDYLVQVPLVLEGALLGYIELGFHDEQIAGLYGQTRRRLLAAAITGLAVVVLLGVFLQLQLSRRATAIARVLEDPMYVAEPTQGAAPNDEFAQSMAAASRVRAALHEAKLEASHLELDLEALAQVMKVGVVLVQKERELVFANARALELVGVSRLQELLPLWPGALDALAPVFESPSRSGAGAARPFFADFPTPGGTRRLRVELCRLGDASRHECILLLNDPEILDTLENDVRLASQLDMLSRVYRTVTHELKAPLSAMMINLDLLRESIDSSGVSETVRFGQERYVAVLREEVDRLSRSLADLLTQKMPPSYAPETFDLRTAVEEVGTLLAPQAGKQGVQLSTQLPSEPVVLIGYRDRLKQALLNVAVNALEAMPNGGRLDMEMQRGPGAARITLADTGPGIPDELLDRVDEPDFTTKGEGSGLGLYMARALVASHGGQIRVRSGSGGTRVEIGLPLLERS